MSERQRANHGHGAERQPLALGLVGCGRLAEAGYVAAVARARDVRLVAVADPDAGRRQHIADLAGAATAAPVATFADAASLLAGAPVDGLILATPAPAHLADAVLAAAAGVPALVEKPPAVDAAGAAELAAVVPAPWVGFNRRFDPGAQVIRHAVPARGYVDLRLEISYRRLGWGAHAVRDDALLDLGPHLIDWARWITRSEVIEVACPVLHHERVALDLALRRGRAHVRAATDRPHAELIELRDERGRLLARHRLGGLVAAVRGRLAGGGPNAMVDSLAGQLVAFARAVRGAPPAGLGTAADGHATMTVLDAARASAARGGHPVPVPHPLPVES